MYFQMMKVNAYSLYIVAIVASLLFSSYNMIRHRKVVTLNMPHRWIVQLVTATCSHCAYYGKCDEHQPKGEEIFHTTDKGPDDQNNWVRSCLKPPRNKQVICHQQDHQVCQPAEADAHRNRRTSPCWNRRCYCTQGLGQGGPVR